MYRPRFTLSFLLIPSILTMHTHADVLYSQTSTDSAQTDFGWYSSSEARPTRNFKHADNFQLESSAQVSSINWWGTTEGLSNTDLSNFDTFQIEFWSSVTQPNGRIRPNILTHTETFNLIDTSPTETGRITSRGAIEYMHSATLTDIVTLEADTMYWISISAHSIDPLVDVWQWQDADNADQISSSWSYQSGFWNYQFDTDSAFELVGVPSPSVMTIALSAIALSTRRQRA